MERILIIEDETKIARFIQLELNHEGYEVELAFDGRDGLELCKSRPFDLVLLDVMLPSLNGFEVLRRIRQFSSVAVILLTAKDDIIDKVLGLDSGADDYITKPFSPPIVLARVRNHVNLKLKSDRLERYANLDGLTDIANRRRLEYSAKVSYRSIPWSIFRFSCALPASRAC